MIRQAIKWVRANRDLLIDVSDQIWQFAELGLEEFKSSKLLIKTLNEAGFSVSSNVADMPNAFGIEPLFAVQLHKAFVLLQ